MTGTIGIVDIFSGPGGLGEGFSRCTGPDGRPAFEIDVSVEKEPTAHATLRLRAFLRQFRDELPVEYIEFLNGDSDGEPDWSSLYPEEWERAGKEALNMTLGDSSTAGRLHRRLSEIRRRRGDRLVLIGGPPCQAYSLAGRGRKPEHKGYVPHAENRHLLYQEYIEVLRRLRPAAFVMENVKGMLSSRTVEGKVLDLVMRDMRAGGGAAEYVLFPLSGTRDLLGDPRAEDFLVLAEQHGIPQTRHRVIIVGVRRDLLERAGDPVLPELPRPKHVATVRNVLGGMPRVRSGLSPRQGDRDGKEAWRVAVADHATRLLGMNISLPRKEATFRGILGRLEDPSRIYAGPRLGTIGGERLPTSCPAELHDWIARPDLTRLTHHETRSHMRDDLGRYLFASAWAAAVGASPKATDFPPELAPAHGNWGSGKFKDRFRAQPWDCPASTVTCHVSKDGHYFIHPDPRQCRSMTVREVARLQTFPDDYHFTGNRTEQYVQVGNAVPPYLAYQIAKVLQPVLSEILDARPRPTGRPPSRRRRTGRPGTETPVPA